ncbi:hypothetical protein DL93DRAFT_2225607 [Clavulina sp. PMI_390]|nr:hypothetical protein DL93DRAFT_2225607 [Clavulina sp. PMI_390]
MPFALHQEIVRPSGVEYAISLNLVGPLDVSSSSDVQILGNLVVARANVLKVFEVRRQLVDPSRTNLGAPEHNLRASGGPLDGPQDDVEMDGQGDGFVSMGELKTRTRAEVNSKPYETRLYLLREHSLHGIVTGLDKIRTISSSEDGLDRLLVSFKDAKIALFEWSEALYDLVTVSIHTYERAPQFTNADVPNHKPLLRVDPGSRCAALLLPADSLAILPFHQTQAELDMLDQENFMRDAPYSPSFVLDVRLEIDTKIRNIIDFVFLPGFSHTTIAILYQTEQTWTSRLNEQKDTSALSIVTVDHMARSYHAIAKVDQLPYDCASLLACPALYGGVMIQASNSVLHVDQASRVTALPLNAWASKTSALPGLVPGPLDDHKTYGCSLGLMLEGAKMLILNDNSILLVLVNGMVHVITIVVDGRLISRLTISEAVGRTSPPSTLQLISAGTGDLLFVGSTSGPGLLLKTAWVSVQRIGTDAQMEVDMEEEIDIDEDLYGDSTYAPVATKTSSSDGPKALQLSCADSLPAWGSLNSFTFGVNEDIDHPLPELIACTGVEGTSTLTRFQNHLPTRTWNKIPAISSNIGLWSLSIRRNSSINAEYPNGVHPDTIIVASHSNPNPGVTRILEPAGESGTTRILWKTPATVIAAGEFFQRTHIVVVTPNKIKLLSSEARELRSIDETELVSASVCDPYILVHRKDGTVVVYAGDATSASLTDAPVFSTADCLLSSFFRERTGAWKLHGASHASGVSEDASRLESVLSGESTSQWLILTRADNKLEVISLPTFDVAFSSSELLDIPSVISDTRSDNASRVAPDSKLSGEVIKLTVAPIGVGDCNPHLVVLTRSNLVVVYEAIPDMATSLSSNSSRSLPSSQALLPIKFIKKLSRALPVQAASSGAPRHLISFSTICGGEQLSGVFGLGMRPFWLVATRVSSVRLHPSSHKVVHAFASTNAFDPKGQFIVQTEAGVTLDEWIPNLSLDADLPYHVVRTERLYSTITYDVTSQHYVAASLMKREFQLFDEETNPLWTTDDERLMLPQGNASAIELVSPHTWETVDGYEFPEYETLTCLQSIPLESNSVESGYRDFIVAGTIVDRGEDLGVRGAVYVFEVVEVVGDEEGKRQHKLKIRCRDDCRGPVTDICGMNGYLVCSVGQKIFVRAFDLDERLVGIAFLDVGVYINSLRAVKNLLLIGDNMQGTWFVAFQEDPYKLVILSKGRQNSSVSSAEFFFGLDGKLSFIAAGDDGIIRALEFNPTHRSSEDGKKLLLRTEFHGQVEHCSSMAVARRRENSESTEKDVEVSSAQSIILFATLDGSITQMLALTDATFKRLSLLQGQLVRNVQHVAGLNPRANRTVRNDAVSRPLTKGILDGALLRAFTDLGAGKQAEMTRQISTSRAVVFRDLGAFSDPW